MAAHSILVAFDAENLEAIKFALSPLKAQLPSASDGKGFVSAFVNLLIQGNSPNAVILNPKLPVLGGKSAALALRAIERAFGTPLTPVLFYSDEPCDVGLKKLINHITRAEYLKIDKHIREDTQLLATLKRVIGQ